MKSLSQVQLVKIGLALGAGYGLFARLCFGMKATGQVFAVMSSSFIFGVPVVLGFLTVWCGEYRAGYGWARRIFMPWGSSLAFLGAALALVWEGIICIVIWLPLMLILSSLGGALAGLVRVWFPAGRERNYCAAFLALAPFIAAPLEHLRQPTTEIRTVATSIDIRASRDTIWQQIRSVPAIREDEQGFALTHLMGFPRPLEARLEGTGVGAVRNATFERGVLFVETITAWDDGRQLAFSIRADTAHIPPTTFDEHVTIGGPYFDVLSGTYALEDLGNGMIRLHLASDQRLSTRFNAYSHLWTEFLMADLQNYILRIIKRRCESPAT